MQEFVDIAKTIKLLILDVDGVLTDGSILLNATGEECKCFHVHDGAGIKRLQQSGIKVAIISGRKSVAVQARLNELAIEHVFLGIHDKLNTFNQLRQDLNIEPQHIAYVGDDFPDIPVMQVVGLSIAVNNATPEVKKIAHGQTEKCGGHGAVREVCDLIYLSQKSIQ